jgi:solute carrier family 41
MSATCLSAALLGSFMCALIVLCRRAGRDPDNIAPPLAACLGDLLTLALFGLATSALLPAPPFVRALVVCAFAAGAAACGLAVRRNKHVAHLLTQGWSPLLGAMVITSGSGLVLDAFVGRYSGYALLAVAFGGAWPCYSVWQRR